MYEKTARPAGLRFEKGWPLFLLLLALLAAPGLSAQELVDPNEPGILEPVTSSIQGKDIRMPNTDQSADGDEQSTVHGPIQFEDALATTSLLGHPIARVSSPNDDMRRALERILDGAATGSKAAMEAGARELEDVLLGTTTGRIYDGFSMLNFNRWTHPGIGAEHFPADAVPGEYKMKVARDTGETFISPYDGETRKIWEVDIAMLYYDGQIDSDTFLLRFPFGHHDDDTVRVNYRILSLVQEDFSPTVVTLDRRQALNTVQFPFKGFDTVWIAFEPGQVLNVTVNLPPLRNLRGAYTWGWRVHPPRIQFLQPVYEIQNQHTGAIELDPQGISYAQRNRDNLVLANIGDAAPEMKMYQVAQAVLGGADGEQIEAWLTEDGEGPRGTWVEWSDLAKEQRQLPPEVLDMLALEGLAPGDFGDFKMISVFLNNEMYGDGPFLNEIGSWQQGEFFEIKLINLDKHTHYFRNVDFGTRLHDDILRCCGGGFTSFEVMNFKPSYGAPKVAEMQWRAGWGFRPHWDVIQQDGVFPRGSDRVQLSPYTSGENNTYFGYLYSDENRRGDFRFNPPPFIIGEDFANPSTTTLKDADGETGLIIGQFTEGYGGGQMCPGDPFPGFCSADIAAYNPHGALNWPPPPLQGQNGLPDHPVELRFPPFLRNPAQGQAGAGDIIPPTGAWRPFLWTNPNNGTLLIDAEDPSKGYWADLTYSHGAPVFAGGTLNATVELPRASGQVFYQFDDLFHDNSIFSPHPLIEAPDEVDTISSLTAVRNNILRVRGTVSKLATGEQAGWVTLFDGSAGSSGCTGRALLSAPVREDDGFFLFRCGGANCNSPMIPGKAGLGAPGAVGCVQSNIGGYADFHLE